MLCCMKGSIKKSKCLDSRNAAACLPAKVPYKCSDVPAGRLALRPPSSGQPSSTQPEVHSGPDFTDRDNPNKNTWKHQRCKKKTCMSPSHQAETIPVRDPPSIHLCIHHHQCVIHPSIHPSIFLPIQSINLSVCPSSIHPSDTSPHQNAPHYSSERSSMTGALCGLIINRGWKGYQLLLI